MYSLFFVDLGNNASPRQQQQYNNNNNNRMRPQQQQQQQQRSAGGLSGRNGEPLKFDSEFDFEQANARFEQEIEKEFDKLKIGSGKGNQQNQVCFSLTPYQFLVIIVVNVKELIK